MSSWEYWAPRPSAALRNRLAKSATQKLTKGGKALLPVERIASTKIATTFWGKSWCTNLERYSDYANRLPRGRSYVRGGCVVHLKVSEGFVEALVSGSSVYDVRIDVAAVSKTHWSAICRDSGGAIASLVELLQGKLSTAMMERLCRPEGGLFPRPRDIRFSCTCPDVASMCKHVAAVLYGVGARLDSEPALLFKLRKVNEADLIARATERPVSTTKKAREGRLLEGQDLSALFELDIASRRAGGKKEAATKAIRKSAESATAKKSARSATAKKSGRSSTTPQRETGASRPRKAR